MATHSSTLAWKIPWTEEPGRLQSMRSRWTQLSNFTFTFHFHALEKEMATHSSVLAWRIPGMGEPGGLPSMGSHRVGHDWRDLAASAATRSHNKRFSNDARKIPHAATKTQIDDRHERKANEPHQRPCAAPNKFFLKSKGNLGEAQNPQKGWRTRRRKSTGSTSSLAEVMLLRWRTYCS